MSLIAESSIRMLIMIHRIRIRISVHSEILEVFVV
nr:MAG TPA: hypothetical protein [Caudoviricetes sp.]